MAMKGLIFIPLVMAALLLAGCHQDNTTAASPPPWEPTEAQPKLATMKIYLGPVEALDTELALTPKQIQTGMMFRTNIQDSDSMLFLLPYPMRADFWMKNCPESISAAYINTDGVIEEIHHLEKNDTNGVFASTDDIRFVLETSDGWFDRHHIPVGTPIRTERGSLADTFLKGQQ
ncbi:MAG TPA: DUF192 domain-containing protein [Candidatus Angelobacter sp.]|jgi:uncharacterized membrane protein (UPF0127 family)|nr:DUF192 domain-containing protein [Candidatus Angelobacter sp.]